MRPTIKDVAKHAGVSVATVSRYLNHSPLIAQESVEKVKASMRSCIISPILLLKVLLTRNPVILRLLSIVAIRRLREMIISCTFNMERNRSWGRTDIFS